MNTNSLPQGTKPTDNREVAALRGALEEAALVVARTDAKLAAAQAELEIEKRRATQHLTDALREKTRASKLQAELDSEKQRLSKLERALFQNQHIQGELEAKLRAEHRDVVQTSSRGLGAAIKIERLETEHKRLKLVIVELTNERDQLRNKVEGKSHPAEEPSAPAARFPRNEFIGAAGPETRAMAMSLQCDATERTEPRGRVR
jgi:chromosome segregation ATPase